MSYGKSSATKLILLSIQSGLATLITLISLWPTPALADTNCPVGPNYVVCEAMRAADRYELTDEQTAQMLVTLKCESDFVSKQSEIINKRTGKREESYGVAQINLPYHPEITKAEALDPMFAVDYTAKNFKQGKQTQWSCWRDHFKS